MSDRHDLQSIITDPLPPPLQLIPKLAPFISGSNSDQAFIALSQSLLQYEDSISDTLRQHLISFLQSVFQFRPQLSPGLAALVEAVYCIGMFPDLPVGLSLLSCDPVRRRSFLKALRSALPPAIPSSLLPALLSLTEDETDPPALLASFQLISTALDRIQSTVPRTEAESVFEHCSIYFPITFNGTSCDGDQLRSWLLECLTSRPEMASFAIPFFLDKLHSTMNQAQIQSLHALSLCMERFLVSDTAPYLSELSSRLTDIWADPSAPPSTTEMSVKLLSSILLRYFSIDSSDKDHQLCSETSLQPILAVISKRLQSSVPVRSSSPYVQALATLCSSSRYSFDQCYELIWPILMQRMISSQDPNEQTISSLVVSDTLVKGFSAEPQTCDPLQSAAIVDTLISISDPSSPSDLLRSTTLSLSKSISVVSFDHLRLKKIIELAASVIHNSSTAISEKKSLFEEPVRNSFEILAQCFLYEAQTVIDATLSKFLSQPDHLQRICILSSAYLKACLPTLLKCRSRNRSVAESLCIIAKECSDDAVSALVSELADNVFYSDEPDLFQAIYTRSTADQQLNFCNQYLSNEFLGNSLASICILHRHPETILSNEAEILDIAFKYALDGNQVAIMIVADLLNKCQNHEVITEFLQSRLQLSIDWSSPKHSSLLIWIIKALACRGESAAFDLAFDLLRYPCHIINLPVLVDDTIPLVSWIILPLYKQRLLCRLLPSILSSDSHLVCLPQLLAHAPRQVILDHTEQLLPVLETTLKSSSAHLSLSALIVLISNNPKCVMGRAKHIIEPLLRLALPPSTTKIRLLSLQTLSEIFKGVPSEEIYPFKPLIKHTLLLALDDDKRLCRQQARECLQVTGWQ